MRDPNEQLIAGMIDGWGEMADQNMRRLSEARRRIRQREYSPTELISDVLGFWLDASQLWLPGGGSYEHYGVPIIWLRLRPDQQAASAMPLPVAAKQGAKVVATDLVHQSQPSPGIGVRQIPAKHVVLELTESYLLHFRLKDLGALGGLEEGRFRGLVLLEGDRPELLAVVYADVVAAPGQPKPPKPPDPPAQPSSPRSGSGGRSGAAPAKSTAAPLTTTAASGARATSTGKKAAVKKAAPKKAAAKKAAPKKTGRKQKSRQERQAERRRQRRGGR